MRILVLLFLLFSSLLFSQNVHTMHASWYGEEFHGKVMANGEKFDMHRMTTAANNSYKLGERLRVTNTANGKSVIVVVTDRGGFAKYGRTLDLSKYAFKCISPLKEGVIIVKIERLKNE